MSRRKERASVCKLKTCNNKVSPTNPSFPYCSRYHGSLKSNTTPLTKNIDEENIDVIREEFYNPDRTATKRNSADAQIIFSSSGINPILSTKVFASWKDKVKEVNIDDPDEAYMNRDSIIKSLMDDIQGSEYVDNAFIAECKKGSFLDTERNRIVRSEDHKIIIVDEGNNAPLYVIDPMPKSALHGSLNDYEGVSSSPQTYNDGIVITSLFEYAAYSGIKFESIINESNGESIWENPSDKQSFDNEERQREIIREYGNQNRHVENYVSKPEIVDEDKEISDSPRDLTIEDVMKIMNKKKGK